MKLEVHNLTKSFREKEVLKGISFHVTSGKALGLLGRNGAGKTTIIRILMDVFKANKGEILFDGKPFDVKQHSIGYLPEERGMYPKKKVMEQLCYFAQLRGMKKKEAKVNATYWLQRLGMEHYKNRRMDTLSKGNQQKVQLAQTLICNPDIIILDEPFSGLDPVNANILKEVVQEWIDQQKIVIFSSHQMDDVEAFCEEIVMLNHGEIVLQGNLKQMKREYGKNRLLLKVQHYQATELKIIIETQLARDITMSQVKGDMLMMELNECVTRNAFLQKLIDLQLQIEEFRNYEPKLRDIFVWKVGDVS